MKIKKTTLEFIKVQVAHYFAPELTDAIIRGIEIAEKLQNISLEYTTQCETARDFITPVSFDYNHKAYLKIKFETVGTHEIDITEDSYIHRVTSYSGEEEIKGLFLIA